VGEPPAPKRSRPTEAHLYFYDSISPIVEADSIECRRVYMAARYDKGSALHQLSYVREEYDQFLDALLAAQSVEGARLGES